MRNSAWNRGVAMYSNELIEAYEDAMRTYERAAHDRKEASAWMRNGASNWKEYSEGGCALIFDKDIAERLCTPSELKRNAHGQKRPNAQETWIDVQTRALQQAEVIALDALLFLF